MSEKAQWQRSACILCSCNCGIQVQVDEQSGTFARIKGDDAHPASAVYVCNKASRLNHYLQMGDRVLHPLRRNESGGFDEISWDTAIEEIAAKLTAIRDEHGGQSIFYYGGLGQGNHLPMISSRSTFAALGMQFQSNAAAQEKTGEFWVCNEMFGAWAHPDLDHCDLAIFVGKNPWQSHGFPRARATLREIKKSPDRKMIVVDPKRTETADLADLHLAVQPGRDAWLFAAIGATLVQENLFDADFIAERTTGAEEVFETLRSVDVTQFADLSGVPLDEVREAAQLIADSERVAVLEDLGTQMNRHSTLVSYLQRLTWVLTGNFGKEGTNYLPLSLAKAGEGLRAGESPATGAPVIGGLIPCNSVAEEALADHPNRMRAMIVETGNPVHSLAESQKFRDAMAALDCTVVLDIAMTETAMEADYVLPTANQYEKAEATFFTYEFPSNYFHLRKPLFTPPSTVLSEAEIHCRLVEAMGALPEEAVSTLKEALEESRGVFQLKLTELLGQNPALFGIMPALLHRTIGETLSEELRNASGLWLLVQMFATNNPDKLAAVGVVDKGEGLAAALFDAILESPSAFTLTAEEWPDTWDRVAGGKIRLDNSELLEEIEALRSGAPDATTEEYPFVLSAGERRDYTANTILRDPDWRRKDREGALLMNPEDGQRLGLSDGALAELTTRAGSARVLVELSDRMRRGHVSLPNGLGLNYPDADGESVLTGVSPNELTSLEDRDKFAGTPWHKGVPARITVG